MTQLVASNQKSKILPIEILKFYILTYKYSVKHTLTVKIFIETLPQPVRGITACHI